MAEFTDFLGGFFGTGSQIVAQKKKERRDKKREEDLRAQKNADELAMYTKKLELKSQASRDEAAEKARRDKEEREYWNDFFNLGANPGMDELNKKIEIGYFRDAPKHVMDGMEFRRKVQQEFKEEQNAPVQSLIDSDTKRQFDDMYSVFGDDASAFNPSPLFPEGKDIPIDMTLAEAKRKKLVTVKDGEVKPNIGVSVEGNVVTQLVSPTANAARKQVMDSEYRAASILAYVSKEKGTKVGPREIDAAGRMEKALNKLDLATSDQERIEAYKEFNSLYKNTIGNKPIELTGQVPLFLNSERQKKLKEAKALLSSSPTEQSSTPLTDKLDSTLAQRMREKLVELKAQGVSREEAYKILSDMRESELE